MSSTGERERAGKIERHVESQLDVEVTAEMAAIKMETMSMMKKMMMGTLVMVIEMMSMVHHGGGDGSG